MENILLFPTLAIQNQFKVSQNEKDIWFETYIKNSDPETGKSHDFLGYETIHHNQKLEFFFKDKLMPTVRGYLISLNIDPKFFDIHVTKTFFNVTDQNGIHEHDHAENHISFVYYPHVAAGKERDLIFYHPEKAHGNEPYTQWFDSNVESWDFINARSFSVPVNEGMMYIFPAKLAHNIQKKEGDTDYIKGFKKPYDLNQTRFCVAGDMIITRKEKGKYRRTLPPVQDWRRFD